MRHIAFRRILSVLMTMTMLLTFAVPSSAAMGFNDLATVVDITGSYTDGDTSTPSGSDSSPAGEQTDTSGSAEQSGDSSNNSDYWDNTTKTASLPDTPALGMSGSADDWELIPDDFVIYTGNIKPLARSDTGTTIYHTTDWSITHTYPFSGSTSTMPAYIFYTADGRASYCIEPARFNSYYGSIVTGSYTYDSLSDSKKAQISKAVAANTSGTSDHKKYFVTQVIIWEIVTGQSHRSGNIYSACIPPNGLSSEYDSMLSAMNRITGEIPSFMSADKNNAPKYDMTQAGASWRATLTNSNSNVTMSSGDFRSMAPFTYSVSGSTLTVTSPTEPDEDSFVEWIGSGGNSGIVFWNSDVQK